MNNLIYYHENCIDGIFGAFEAWKFFKNNALFFPIKPDTSLESLLNVKDSVIYFIDVFPKYMQNSEILNKTALNNRIIVIDHHKSCMEFLVNYYNHNVIKFTQNNMSGTSLANEYFKNKKEFYVDYIEDWDLFQFKYGEKTENFHYFLESLKSLEFSDLEKTFNSISEEECLNKGKIIKEYSEILIKKLLLNEHFTYVTGEKIPCINSSVFISKLGNLLSEKYKTEYPYSIIYYKTANYTKYSLRTVREDIDLNKKASEFGGGGHKKASGFIINENI